MKRHGASHGAATLVATLSAALLIDLARGHLPAAARALDSLSMKLQYFTRMDVSVELISAILLATILAIVWGLAFGLVEKRVSDRE